MQELIRPCFLRGWSGTLFLRLNIKHSHFATQRQWINGIVKVLCNLPRRNITACKIVIIQERMSKIPDSLSVLVRNVPSFSTVPLTIRKKHFLLCLPVVSSGFVALRPILRKYQFALRRHCRKIDFNCQTPK